MLYINSEPLIISNKSADYKLKDYVAEYQEGIKKLRKEYGDVIILKSKRKPRKENMISLGSVQRFLRPISPISLPLESTFFNKETSSYEEWTYTKHHVKYKDGSLDGKYDRVYMVKDGQLVLDLRSQPDLAFYAIFKSGKVGETENDSGKFYIHNERNIAKAVAVDRKIEGQLTNTIYNELDFNKVAILAKSYGVVDVDTKSHEQVRNDLYEKVKSNEESKRKDNKVRGINDFMKDCNIDLKVQVGSLVQDAIDKDTVIFNVMDRRWELDYGDGQANFILCDVERGDISNTREVLIDYLVDDQGALERVKKQLGVSGLLSISLEPIDILKEKNPQKLKKIAKEYCPDLKFENTAKAAEIQYAILEDLFSKDIADQALKDFKE